MTMHHAPHPDDERLAAYAGDDADALADRALVEHLTACDRCRPMVEELTLLRGALADLPDLLPSRPLRLIPPVPAPAARRSGPLEWLRRLAAPAMAAGAGLALVGAIGAIGSIGAAGTVADLSRMGAGSASSQEGNASDGAKVPALGGGSPSISPSITGDGTYLGQSAEPRSPGSSSPASAAATSFSAATASQAPRPSAAEGLPAPQTPTSPGQPWQTLLIAGFALFGISAVLRYSLAPRAG
jgi:hypothetical protein